MSFRRTIDVATWMQCMLHVMRETFPDANQVMHAESLFQELSGCMQRCVFRSQ